MIGSIKGKVVRKTEKFLVVETLGVGYKVNTPVDIIAKTKSNEEIMLWIHTHVREDALDLYGFVNSSDLEFFEMLISVSGIGPKSALAILGITSPETLRRAIASGDTTYLTKISGIGKKTAEKIVLELRDKMGEETSSDSLRDEIDALEALKALGYSQNEAREALKKIASNLPTNAKIKEALKVLGGK